MSAQNNIKEIVKLARLSLIRDIQIQILKKSGEGFIINQEIVEEILKELEN